MEKNKIEGFTLIELLLVIGIIAILAVAVFVALDPAKRFADSRNARRTSDVETILSAVHQYIIDNRGALPANLDSTEKQIGTANSGCSLTYGDCSANVDYCIDMSVSNEAGGLAKYLKTPPFDPQNGSSSTTHYTIQSDSNGIVTVTACDAEGGTTIQASR